MSASVLEELGRLRDAAESGALAEFCRRHGIDLMVLFGSAVRCVVLDPDARAPSTQPRDIDIAVRIAVPRKPFGVGKPEPDPLVLLEEMYELTGSERIDLMMLHRAGPVARQRALGRGRKLYEAEPGIFAEAQIAAMMEYYDTEPLRRLRRELLASR